MLSPRLQGVRIRQPLINIPGILADKHIEKNIYRKIDLART
jgi:hypothetical protein